MSNITSIQATGNGIQTATQDCIKKNEEFDLIEGQTSVELGFVPKNLVKIYLNGVLQTTSDYTVDGTTLTFNEAYTIEPDCGNTLIVCYEYATPPVGGGTSEPMTGEEIKAQFELQNIEDPDCKELTHFIGCSADGTPIMVPVQRRTVTDKHIVRGDRLFFQFAQPHINGFQQDITVPLKLRDNATFFTNTSTDCEKLHEVEFHISSGLANNPLPNGSPEYRVKQTSTFGFTFGTADFGRYDGSKAPGDMGNDQLGVICTTNQNVFTFRIDEIGGGTNFSSAITYKASTYVKEIITVPCKGVRQTDIFNIV